MRRNIKYGGALTPSEAAQTNKNGEIPEQLARQIGGSTFGDRLAWEVKTLSMPEEELRLIKDFLAAYGGKGANPVGATCFAGRYKAGIEEQGAGIPKLWSRPEAVFMAAYCFYVRPLPHYQRALAKMRPRNSRSREEWERMKQAATA